MRSSLSQSCLHISRGLLRWCECDLKHNFVDNESWARSPDNRQIYKDENEAGRMVWQGGEGGGGLVYTVENQKSLSQSKMGGQNTQITQQKQTNKNTNKNSRRNKIQQVGNKLLACLMLMPCLHLSIFTYYWIKCVEINSKLVISLACLMFMRCLRLSLLFTCYWIKCVEINSKLVISLACLKLSVDYIYPYLHAIE